MIVTNTLRMNMTQGEFGPPDMYDILLPPAVALFLMILGLLMLSLITQPTWWRNICCKTNSSIAPQKRRYLPQNVGIAASIPTFVEEHEETVYSIEDKQIIHKFSMFQNNPWSLFKVAAPALISVAFCPVTIYLQPQALDFFYPEFMGGRRNINDALAVFLLPAGLVYAMAFGFALQDTLAKLDVTTGNADHHLTILRQCRQLIGCSGVMTSQLKARLFKHLCGTTTHWMQTQMNSKYYKTYGSDIWHILKLLQVCKRENSSEEKVMDALFDKAMELDSLTQEGYRGARANINFLQWAFMELLGFISFFGILLIVADSYRMELTMCVLTVFTISAFVYILADLDYAYHGTFIVDLGVFVEYLEELNDHFIVLRNEYKNTVVTNEQHKDDTIKL